jgi:hypothetical protein
MRQAFCAMVVKVSEWDYSIQLVNESDVEYIRGPFNISIPYNY